jgi:hypothetical protein
VTVYAISLNDRSDDTDRQRLKEFIPKLINSRDGKEKLRADFFVLAAIARVFPLLTDALDLPDISNRLRAFKNGEWSEVREYIQSQKETLRRSAADAVAHAAAYRWQEVRTKIIAERFKILTEAIEIK